MTTLRYRQKAKRAVYDALHAGEITRPSHCSVPGCDRKFIDGHHEDYDKPLEVVWLCRSHHQQLHRERGDSGWWTQ